MIMRRRRGASGAHRMSCRDAVRCIPAATAPCPPTARSCARRDNDRNIMIVHPIRKAIAVIVLATLAGCAGAPVTQAPEPVPPSVASPTPAATTVPTPTATTVPTPTATIVPTPTATPVPAQQFSGYPIGRPGRLPGDGFFIRHGYAVENTWFNPNHWHAGEDWYAVTQQSARRACTRSSGRPSGSSCRRWRADRIVLLPVGRYSMVCYA
jgi:hypothetical protein